MGRSTVHKPTAWGVLILIGFTTVLFLFADLAGWLGSQSAGLRLLAVLLTVIVAGGAWLLASSWLPHGECKWWAFLPGALIVGVGVGLLHLATVTYIAYEVTKKSSTYGTIGVAVGLLLWTYLLGRLLTASIATNADFVESPGEPIRLMVLPACSSGAVRLGRHRSMPREQPIGSPTGKKRPSSPLGSHWEYRHEEVTKGAKGPTWQLAIEDMLKKCVGD